MKNEHQTEGPRQIRHVGSIAEIVDDMDAAVAFYRNVLQMHVEHEPDAPYAVVKVPGILHYGLWSRAHAAEAIYGDASLSGSVPLGISVAFEVDSVESAVEQTRAEGAAVLQEPREEPWGQRTARFRLPSGAVGELAETPWARELPTDAPIS